MIGKPPTAPVQTSQVPDTLATVKPCIVRCPAGCCPGGSRYQTMKKPLCVLTVVPVPSQMSYAASYWPLLPFGFQLQPVWSPVIELSAAGKPHSFETESEYWPQNTVG